MHECNRSKIKRQEDEDRLAAEPQEGKEFNELIGSHSFACLFYRGQLIAYLS
ncbi:hypothetical protein Sgly_0835 [Syntrophobotulus glycolicus DSM 8271]|uniref:Uncharacterized protein n=1 Tax=Syntrophobotulus glycolicus (strain DSM 8271 / FlGlyR) TaxID=645991 RepID=F0T1C1_SYNGF|nr:hypothetical protein Sgly_0835 [Syntrophobotulus glycolicus DSM 8271]